MTVRLLGGLVLFVSTLYCGPRARSGLGRGTEGSGLYTELLLLGFSEGSSPGLVGLVGRLTALLPSYEQAHNELKAEGLVLNSKTVYRISKRLGAEMLTRRTRDLLEYRAGLMPAGTTLHGKKVGAAIDGGRVRTRVRVRKKRDKNTGKKRRQKYRTTWREPKLLIIFECDDKGRMKRNTRPWIDGTFEGPDEIMELLAMHLHRLGAVSAKLVVFLADGAPWIWERTAWVQQRVGLKPAQVVEVLDFCHAIHHVSLALEALHLPQEERKKLYREMRGLVKKGRVFDVTAALTDLAAGMAEKSSVWTEIAYLENHGGAGRMAYRKFRRLGVPLGSGAIESAIRRVVNLRLKGNGILWYDDNAEGMLLLRAAALTGRWHEELEKVRVTMRRSRKVSWRWTSPDMPEQLKAKMEIKPPEAQKPLGQGGCGTAA